MRFAAQAFKILRIQTLDELLPREKLSFWPKYQEKYRSIVENLAFKHKSIL
jgi:hypothetical protein